MGNPLAVKGSTYNIFQTPTKIDRYKIFFLLHKPKYTHKTYLRMYAIMSSFLFSLMMVQLTRLNISDHFSLRINYSYQPNESLVCKETVVQYWWESEILTFV